MNQNDQNDNYCASTLGVSAPRQADLKVSILSIFVLLRVARSNHCPTPRPPPSSTIPLLLRCIWSTPDAHPWGVSRCCWWQHCSGSPTARSCQRFWQLSRVQVPYFEFDSNPEMKEHKGKNETLRNMYFMNRINIRLHLKRIHLTLLPHH